jgi:hypothetical protein
MEGNKNRGDHAGKSEKGGEPGIIWDDSQARTFSPNVAQVKAVREEVWLLFGTTQRKHSDQNDLLVESPVRVIMSPFTAKQLSIALDHVIQKYMNPRVRLAILRL